MTTVWSIHKKYTGFNLIYEQSTRNILNILKHSKSNYKNEEKKKKNKTNNKEKNKMFTVAYIKL